MTFRGELVTILLALLPVIAPATSVAGPWQYEAKQSKPGRIYYYERTNSDGSLDERVTVFQRDAVHLEVFKAVGRCENAAFVTAEMDLKSLSALKITGGQLRPGASQNAFAFLSWKREAQTLDVEVKLPDQTIRASAPIRSAPWHLFDFDLASLTVATPHLAPNTKRFSFGMALLWPDAAADSPLNWMGDVQATLASMEQRDGKAVRLYSLSGDALSGPRSVGSSGQLLLDAKDGHIVEALLPMPNHPGYKDFRLFLKKVSDVGESEWTSLLKSHFEGCPKSVSQ